MAHRRLLLHAVPSAAKQRPGENADYVSCEASDDGKGRVSWDSSAGDERRLSPATMKSTAPAEAAAAESTTATKPAAKTATPTEPVATAEPASAAAEAIATTEPTTAEAIRLAA